MCLLLPIGLTSRHALYGECTQLNSARQTFPPSASQEKDMEFVSTGVLKDEMEGCGTDSLIKARYSKCKHASPLRQSD